MSKFKGFGKFIEIWRFWFFGEIWKILGNFGNFNEILEILGNLMKFSDFWKFLEFFGNLGKLKFTSQAVYSLMRCRLWFISLVVTCPGPPCISADSHFDCLQLWNLVGWKKLEWLKQTRWQMLSWDPLWSWNAPRTDTGRTNGKFLKF